MSKSKEILVTTTIMLLLSLSLVQCAEKDASAKMGVPETQNKEASAKMGVPETQNKEASAKMGDPMNRDDMSDMDIMGALSDCNDTFRIEMSFLLALNESGSFPDEADRTPKCYVRCVLEMVDVASADGQFDPERAEVALMGIRGVRALTNVKETAMACAADRKESCKCERSYQFIKCLMEAEIMMAEKS